MVSSITHVLRGQVDFWTLAVSCAVSMTVYSFLFRKHTHIVGAVIGAVPLLFLPDYSISLPACCAFLNDIEPAWLLPSMFFSVVLLLLHLFCSPPRRSEDHYIIDEDRFSEFNLVTEDNRGREWTLEEIPELVAEMRSSYNSGITRPIAKRIEQLQQLLRFFQDNEKRIVEAVSKDLGRPNMELLLYECDVPVSEIKLMIRKLSEWSQPEEVGFHILSFPSSQYIQAEPLGLSLVMGTWNYPVQLTVPPVAAAIAAGNTVILKPSNISKHTARLLAEELPKYMDPRVVQVVGANYDVTPEFDGDYHVSTELSKHRYDIIFFTGSANVGKVVMKAASKFLTRVVLELGGKNPVYVDKSANIDLAAKRCVWARMFNAGQQCIAPDYVMCHNSIKKEFTERCKHYAKEFYAHDPTCESIGRIVSEKRMNVLQTLLSDIRAYGDDIAVGGNLHFDERYIDPTVVDLRDSHSPFMSDETFGPIIGIFGVDNVNEAVDYINSREKPLALYLFAEDSAVESIVINNTSSGGVTVNNCLFHAGHPGLPFGGVGFSGTGAYHGKHGFDAFSHMKPVLQKAVWNDFGALSDPFFLYPPYNSLKVALVRALARL